MLAVGADNMAWDVIGLVDPETGLPGHLLLLARSGIYIIENLQLEELAAAVTFVSPSSAPRSSSSAQPAPRFARSLSSLRRRSPAIATSLQWALSWKSTGGQHSRDLGQEIWRVRIDGGDGAVD